MRYVAVVKCLHGLTPKYVSHLFERNDIQYDLKHDNLILPNCNTNRYGRKSFTCNVTCGIHCPKAATVIIIIYKS